MSNGDRPLRMGMVGGGRDAFIGEIHRAAARLDGQIDFVAGALSSSPEKSVESGRDLRLAEDRCYPTWEAMLEGELARPEGDRIDFISIVTPNHVHYPVARAFVDAGIHVVCDKPMTLTVDEAEDLASLVKQRGVVFCVTYNYSGYPMVRQARHLVRGGAIGDVRKVIVEYNQGWLATELESTGQKQADWRTDPARAGAGGAIGDIGSHAEQLISNVTGLHIDTLCADLSSFIEGRRLDDDANVLLRFDGGARGILTASQVCIGSLNDLRLRVWGTTGGLTWHQEEPNSLRLTSLDGPDTVHHRGGGWASARRQSMELACLQVTRKPSSKPLPMSTWGRYGPCERDEMMARRSATRMSRKVSEACVSLMQWSGVPRKIAPGRRLRGRKHELVVPGIDRAVSISSRSSRNSG